MSSIWILEDARDREDEAAPQIKPPPASPAPYVCHFCSARFKTNDLLLDHFSEEHRGDRPVLLLEGREPVGSYRITKALQARDVVTQNCTSCRLTVNGGKAIAVPGERLGELLSRQRDSLAEMELFNAFDRSAQPIQQSYRLTFRVASVAEMYAVERAFRKHLAVDAPTWETIDAFLKEPACKTVARDYAAGLAAYVRGVIVKDRPASVTVTLPYAEYRELYGAALEILQSYQRTFAGLVSMIIRFSSNDFASPDRAVKAPQLREALQILAHVAADQDPVKLLVPARSVNRETFACPIDDGLARVLALSSRLLESRHWSTSLEEECRQAASAVQLDIPDRQKILALWAAAALRLGAVERAQEPLATLAATHPFDKWAARERERSATG